VPDRKLEVPDLRSGGIRLNLTPDSNTVMECWLWFLPGKEGVGY